MDEAIFAVFNPQSGKGRGAAFVAPVLLALGSRARVEHALTRGPGDEARLAREAIGRGFRRIVAVGGVGTWSNVGNAILSTGAPARLGLVPGGTGCDFAKTVGVPPRDLHAACVTLIGGGAKKILIDMEGQDFIDSSGIGAVISIAKLVRSRKGDIAIMRVPAKIEPIFTPVNLQRFISFRESPEDAMNFFRFV